MTRAASEPPGDAPPLEEGRSDPWIETPLGMLFFVNAVLVGPEYCVLLPLGVRTLLRGLGMAQAPSVFLDTFPWFAARALPYFGWLLLLPVGLVIKNLRVERTPKLRAALLLFLTSHLAFLGYMVLSWFGLVGG